MRCPHCGAFGSRDTKFDYRGTIEGSPAYSCESCQGGLIERRFRKALAVSPDDWRKHKRRWKRERKVEQRQFGEKVDRLGSARVVHLRLERIRGALEGVQRDGVVTDQAAMDAAWSRLLSLLHALNLVMASGGQGDIASVSHHADELSIDVDRIVAASREAQGI